MFLPVSIFHSCLHVLSIGRLNRFISGIDWVEKTKMFGSHRTIFDQAFSCTQSILKSRQPAAIEMNEVPAAAIEIKGAKG